MQDHDDEEMIVLLNRARFTAPPIDQVWRVRNSKRPARRPMRFLAVAAALLCFMTVSIGFAAARVGWLNEFTPGGQCPSGDLLCGTDFAQVALSVDHRTDITMVNVLVKPGLSAARLHQISETLVQRTSGHRVIVYLFSDLPAGPMGAGFAQAPMSDDASAPRPLSSLLPYWLMTYDHGPFGVDITMP